MTPRLHTLNSSQLSSALNSSNMVVLLLLPMYQCNYNYRPPGTVLKTICCKRPHLATVWLALFCIEARSAQNLATVNFKHVLYKFYLLARQCVNKFLSMVKTQKRTAEYTLTALSLPPPLPEIALLVLRPNKRRHRL